MMTRLCHIALSILFCLIISFFYINASIAAEYYVDPSRGNINNNGSFNAPWSTLQEVFEHNKIESQEPQISPSVDNPFSQGGRLIVKNPGAPVKASDIIYLMDGYHGVVDESLYYNSDYITIMNYEGHSPVLGYWLMNGGCKWRLDGLTITPSAQPGWSFGATGGDRYDIIKMPDYGYSETWSLNVRNCTIYTDTDIGNGYLYWTGDNWQQDLWCGIAFTDDSVYENNTIFNVFYVFHKHSSTQSADNIEIIGNYVKNFGADAIQFIGGTHSNILISDNTIKNSMKSASDQHTDFIQTEIGTFNDFTVTRNKFIEWDPADNDWSRAGLSRPFDYPVQGITMGYVNDAVISNNIIITRHSNAAGCGNCTGDSFIVNNTVFDPRTLDNGVNNGDQPTLRFYRPQTGTFIFQNNVAPHLGTDEGVTYINNVNLSNGSLDENSPENVFASISSSSWDLTPSEGGPLVDQGSSLNSPPVLDIRKAERPFNGTYDIGAYEAGAAISDNVDSVNTNDSEPSTDENSTTDPTSSTDSTTTTDPNEIITDLVINGQDDVTYENTTFSRLIINDSTNITIRNCQFTSESPSEPVADIDRSNNLVIANCDFYGSSIACTGMSITNSTNINLNQNRIHDLGDDGIEFGNVRYLNMIGNHIYSLVGDTNNCSNGHSDGIELYNVDDAVFDSNFIYDVRRTSAFFPSNFGGICERLTLRNNIFYVPESGYVMYLHYINDIRLYNNTFWGARYGGISLDADTVNNLVARNNIVQTWTFGYAGDPQDDEDIDYSIIGVNGSYQDYVIGANDIVAEDPQFVAIPGVDGSANRNPNPGDFELSESSPAINNGIEGSELPVVDFFGNPRQDVPDIGAIELFDSSMPSDNIVPNMPVNMRIVTN